MEKLKMSKKRLCPRSPHRDRDTYSPSETQSAPAARPTSAELMYTTQATPVSMDPTQKQYPKSAAAHIDHLGSMLTRDSNGASSEASAKT
jgi:hypothetical protein